MSLSLLLLDSIQVTERSIEHSQFVRTVLEEEEVEVTFSLSFSQTYVRTYSTIVEELQRPPREPSWYVGWSI